MAMFLTHARLRGIFTCIRYFIHSFFSCFFLDKALFWPDGIELFACFVCRSFHVGRSTWRSWSHEYVTSYPFYMDAWIFVTSVTITNYVFAGGVVKWWGPGFQPWLGHFFVFFFMVIFFRSIKTACHFSWWKLEIASAAMALEVQYSLFFDFSLESLNVTQSRFRLASFAEF